jgi:two-component system, NarL family, sensor kinase
MIKTEAKKRTGSAAGSTEPGSRGANGPAARKTPRRTQVRRATRPARVVEGTPQAIVLERPRGHSAVRADATAAELLARERRRMAADVHDLIMQDLSLALATARMLSDDSARAGHAAIVVAACERALAGARSTVDALVAHEARPVIDAVAAAACAAARDVPLSFAAEAVPAGAQPDEATLDTLVHVAREAVTNAVKHAAPSAVEVVLEYGERWRLLVRDDGRGFDFGGAQRGFGLGSMGAQARALGGRLRVSSAPGLGTIVEATLP